MDTLTDTELSTTNYKSKIIAVVIILPLLSLLVLMLRLVSRRLKHVKLYYDDYLATTAWVYRMHHHSDISTNIREVIRCR